VQNRRSGARAQSSLASQHSKVSGTRHGRRSYTKAENPWLDLDDGLEIARREPDGAPLGVLRVLPPGPILCMPLVLRFEDR